MSPSVSFIVRARPDAIRFILPTRIVVAGGLGFFLGEADRRDFGIGVDAVRDRDGIERARAVAGDHLRRDDAFFHRLVREHRRAGDVADGVDAVDLRAALRVDVEEAFVGGLQRPRPRG